MPSNFLITHIFSRPKMKKNRVKRRRLHEILNEMDYFLSSPFNLFYFIFGAKCWWWKCVHIFQQLTIFISTNNKSDHVPVATGHTTDVLSIRQKCNTIRIILMKATRLFIISPMQARHTRARKHNSENHTSIEIAFEKKSTILLVVVEF